MKSIKEYWNILSKKGLGYAFRETWRTLGPVSYTKHQMRYLKKHYAKKLCAYPLTETEVPKIIWVCWLQGVENAPQLVQDCVAQMHRWATGYDIRIVTNENMSDYVDIPEFIMHKLQTGTITYTHFSDILRIFLLERHGGIWMDATVMLNGPIPDYVTRSPLFFFQKREESRHPHVGSSWLIAAAPNHPVAHNVVNLLTCYWEKEKYMRDYFLFHDLVTLAIKETEAGRQAMADMPYVSNVLPHTYTQESFEEMPIHKLSYKHAIDYHLYIQ